MGVCGGGCGVQGERRGGTSKRAPQEPSEGNGGKLSCTPMLSAVSGAKEKTQRLGLRGDVLCRIIGQHTAAEDEASCRQAAHAQNPNRR